jgi:hypothetical protein
VPIGEGGGDGNWRPSAGRGDGVLVRQLLIGRGAHGPSYP